MLIVHGRKIIFLLGFFLVIASAKAQNRPQFDNRRLHFGFTLNGSYNLLQMNTAENFLEFDTLLNVRQQPFIGFGLGAIVDLKLNKYFSLRSLGPTISFAQRNIYYDFKRPESNRKAEIESVYVEFPIELKFKSERHWTTRW